MGKSAAPIFARFGLNYSARGFVGLKAGPWDRNHCNYARSERRVGENYHIRPGGSRFYRKWHQWRKGLYPSA